MTTTSFVDEKKRSSSRVKTILRFLFGTLLMVWEFIAQRTKQKTNGVKSKKLFYQIKYHVVHLFKGENIQCYSTILFFRKGIFSILSLSETVKFSIKDIFRENLFLAILHLLQPIKNIHSQKKYVFSKNLMHFETLKTTSGTSKTISHKKCLCLV